MHNFIDFYNVFVNTQAFLLFQATRTLPMNPETAQSLKDLFSLMLKIGLLAGALSMALIQMFKDLLPIRRWLQRKWIRGWLKRRANLWPAESSSRPDRDEAERELILLATANDVRAFYNLPIEQLCGQMTAAAQAALASPEIYYDLVRSLGAAPEKERERRDRSRKKVEETTKDVKLEIPEKSDFDWLVSPPKEDLRKAQFEATQGLSDARRLESYMAARNRYTNQIQRSVDGLQIAVGLKWKLGLQLAALALSVLGAGFISFSIGHAPREIWLVTLLSGLLGGFLAPILRDLLAGLQSLRK